MNDWYDDAEFWDEVAPLLFDEQRLAGTDEEVDQILEHLEIFPSATVLDLACGIGRHAIELARRGFAVTGLDHTIGLIERGQKSAEAEDLEIEWTTDDMREFVRPGAFNGVINIFSSFGYFTDPTDDARVARNAFESLKPGGLFIIDTMGREIIARDFVERDWRRIRDLLLIEKRHVKQDWGWLQNDWTVIDPDDRVYRCSWGIRLYTGTGLRDLLREAGFGEVDLYGNLAGAPYDPDADRLVAIARKT